MIKEYRCLVKINKYINICAKNEEEALDNIYDEINDHINYDDEVLSIEVIEELEEDMEDYYEVYILGEEK